MIIKNVFIVRHGHADFMTSNDFDRPLTSTGQKAVLECSKFIQQSCKKSGIELDKCISSGAIRTKQTAEIICEHIGINDLKLVDALYNATTGDWLNQIQNTNSRNIVIVGHNPTMSSLVTLCANQASKMKPSNCGFFQLEIDNDGVRMPAKLIDFYNHEF